MAEEYRAQRGYGRNVVSCKTIVNDVHVPHYTQGYSLNGTKSYEGHWTVLSTWCKMLIRYASAGILDLIKLGVDHVHSVSLPKPPVHLQSFTPFQYLLRQQDQLSLRLSQALLRPTLCCRSIPQQTLLLRTSCYHHQTHSLCRLRPCQSKHHPCCQQNRRQASQRGRR